MCQSFTTKSAEEQMNLQAREISVLKSRQLRAAPLSSSSLCGVKPGASKRLSVTKASLPIWSISSAVEWDCSHVEPLNTTQLIETGTFSNVEMFSNNLWHPHPHQPAGDRHLGPVQELQTPRGISSHNRYKSPVCGWFRKTFTPLNNISVVVKLQVRSTECGGLTEDFVMFQSVVAGL